MRALHVVKTSDGAVWAARQARALRRLGIEIHVAVPSAEGRAVPEWEKAGAVVHVADLQLPVRSPARLPAAIRAARRLVDEVRPDVIHSHFVTTTCLLRIALGPRHPVPRVYQVAGPLHLEHWPSRLFETSLAGPSDSWIASSRVIADLYRRAGIPAGRVHLSYYGPFDEAEEPAGRSGDLRRRVGAAEGDLVVGNMNFMYAPRRLLGQPVGVKCHEDVIDALGVVTRARPEVLGVFVGASWGGASWYEEQLHQRARQAAGDRIRFAGRLPPDEARRAWADFDLGIHVPLSENCGGVCEPLLMGVPVIASRVGGLPEIVIEGRTGYLVPPRRPDLLARTILQVLDDLPRARALARQGQRLSRAMFGAGRTAREIAGIYRYVLGQEGERPDPFDSVAFVGA